MTKLSELLKEVGNLEKKLKELELDVQNREAKKANLEEDIRILTFESKELSKKVKDLKSVVSEEVEKTLALDRVKISNLEAEKKTELEKVKEDRGKALEEKERYEKLSEQVQMGIDKNNEYLRSLETKQKEVHDIKVTLLKVIDTIQGILK